MRFLAGIVSPKRSTLKSHIWWFREPAVTASLVTEKSREGLREAEKEIMYDNRADGNNSHCN